MAVPQESPLNLTIDDLLVDPESIPSPPMLVMQIIRMADSPDVSISALAKLVEQDAPLAATFVRMANSSLFSPSREITSVQRALIVVGLRSVRILALSTSMQSLLPTSAGGAESALARRRSLVNAISSKMFLDKVDRDMADQAFLAGLLGHIGMLVLAAEAPEAYYELSHTPLVTTSFDPDGLEEAGAADPWPTPTRQLDVLGFTADELTARLTESWGLPNYISDAIRYRSGMISPAEPLDEKTSLVIKGLELGTAVENVVCGHKLGEEMMSLTVTAEEHFGIDLDQVSQILLDIEPIVAETAGLMSFDLPPGHSHAELLAEAMMKMQAISLDAVSALDRESQAVEQLSERNRLLESENRRDALTGLLNRRGFDSILTNELERRRDMPEDDVLGLVVFDIDHFKSVNDTYGHQVGDDVLREVGQAFRRVSRRSEHVARQGGEEFALIMPHTSLAEMKLAAERLRREVAGISLLVDGQEVLLTISAGGAGVSLVSSLGIVGDLYQRADEMLYSAKNAGRDQSVIDTAVVVMGERSSLSGPAEPGSQMPAKQTDRVLSGEETVQPS